MLSRFRRYASDSLSLLFSPYAVYDTIGMYAKQFLYFNFNLYQRVVKVTEFHNTNLRTIFDILEAHGTKLSYFAIMKANVYIWGGWTVSDLMRAMLRAIRISGIRYTSVIIQIHVNAKNKIN